MKPGAYLFQGDARALPLADASVQCVVTSPPYWGLRDYGIAGQLGFEPTPELYVAHMVEVFREVRRVLRDDGTCWCNLGDSFQEKQLVGIPWRVAFALQADGWWLRSDVIWSKPNPMPESITDRPTKAHEYLFLLTKRARYYYDAEAIKEPSEYPPGSRDDKARGDFNGKWAGVSGKEAFRSIAPLRNRRSVWTIATQPYPEAHFATFPEALVEPCILAGTRLGDRVLDPFAGSGTTVAVAERLGRVGIGVELKPEYLALARRRTVQAGLL